MSYTVLARRYRSQTFDDVLGQDAVAQTLKNAIKTGRVAHAYLFCGTRGCGKTTMARILAKSLNCLSVPAPTTEPCLKCDSCVAINKGEDIDVLEIDGASNTGVDHVRQLRDNAAYRPARARFKIYIIDEVHMLSTGAFNALLKILEEPPSHVKFIFATTEPHKVLATIQSRCQRFDFRYISPEIIGKQVSAVLNQEGIAFEPDLLAAIGRLANGSMRDALSLLDQLISAAAAPLTAAALYALVGMPDRQQLVQLLVSVAQHDGEAVLKRLDELICRGQSTSEICDAVVDLMRETMVYLASGRSRQMLTLTEQEWQDVQTLADRFDIAGLVYAITAIERLRWQIRNSPASRALLEALMLRLTLSEQFIGLERLVAGSMSQQQGIDAAKKKDLTNESIPQNLPLSSTPEQTAVLSVAENGTRALQEGACDAESARFVHFSGQQVPSAGNDTAPLTLIEQVGQRLGGNAAAMLAKATQADWHNHTLQIWFANDNVGKMACQMCQSKQPLVQKALSELLGRPVAVQFSVLSHNPKNTADSLFASSEPPAASPTDLSAGQQEALNDPIVGVVLREMNAKIIDIQKIQFKSLERMDAQEDVGMDEEYL